MLSQAQIQQAIKNLDLLIANPDCLSSWFTLNAGELTKNWFLQNDEQETGRLQSYLQGLIDEISSESVDFNDRSYFSLFISLQYFLHLQPNQILAGINLNLANNPYLQRNALSLKRLGHEEQGNHFKEDIDAKRLPEIHYNPRTGHYTSPDDDKAHQHGNEARRIFFATQIERFKAFCNWLFAKIGIHIFEASRYREHDYLDSEIYTHDSPIELKAYDEKMPSHYWIGHASNLIVIPTYHSPIHVLTDPVEGDLAPLIYPRMTDEARLIDGADSQRLPKIDVVLISHNHRDHLSENTLKRLVKQQPKMIVPEGDEDLFLNLGFRDIVSLKWWEQASIADEQGQERLRVTSVPARHWSGRSFHDAHRSAFNGYVLHSDCLNGDIYFAGDTALMSEELVEPILTRFNIITSIQPGGPDERREDMESTHQSSADGILMHFKILLAVYKKMKVEREELSLEEFLEGIFPLKTIYNHTATFKLGNLRLKDTHYSYQRMIAAFQESEQWRATHLPEHEQNVYNSIQHLIQQMTFANEGQLTNSHVVEQIIRAVIIPKIGQSQDLYFRTDRQQNQSAFQHRHLITNRRALIEFDTLLHRFVTSDHEDFNPRTVLLSMLDNYERPWHAFFTRSHLNLAIYRREIESCQSNLDDLLAALNNMEMMLGDINQHGHMQSLIHYAKWLIMFTSQHQGQSQAKLKDYLVCQEIREQVNQETYYTKWIPGAAARTTKRQAFIKLAENLVKLPAEKDSYRTAIDLWLEERIDEERSVKQMLSENRSQFFAKDQTRSEKIVNGISRIVSGC